MNPWETLGVSKGASQEDIKSAWRKKAMRFHPDRGGDAELFKQALFAYEVLCGRWQARSASTGTQSGQGEEGRAGEKFEQTEDFPRYAQAYYDAWYSVLDNIRFWFSFFSFLHGVSLIFAFPLFFGGGLLLLAGLLFGKPSGELVYSDVYPCGRVWRAGSCSLHEVLGSTAGRPPGQVQPRASPRVDEQSTGSAGGARHRKTGLRPEAI